MRSEPFQHTQAIEQHPGGYQWWYFDATSASGKYHIVVIFYWGNPFSTRYIRAFESQKEGAPNPSEYPGISISIYENGRPIYYSFTEFDEADCNIRDSESRLIIGKHRMNVLSKNDGLSYILELEEELPCGDCLEGKIQFQSTHGALKVAEKAKQMDGHCWNLIQPRSEVQANINLIIGERSSREICFSGTGYHDQNAGKEPMKEHFSDWYWGRFHFQAATLIYYVMNQNDGEQLQNAWLLNPDSGAIIDQLIDIELNDSSRSIFGLSSAHRLSLEFEQADVQIQQSVAVDDGPFYQRFLSEGFLNRPEDQLLESSKGITEYIDPHRIHARLFWPLVNMRIRQAHQKPHWVQRSRRLYQWTW